MSTHTTDAMNATSFFSKMMPPPPNAIPRPLTLVTGVSGGIGADLTRVLARDGHVLVLVARREAPVQALAGELAACAARVAVIPANRGAVDAASEWR